LIIDSLELHPRLREQGISRSGIDRPIDIFGAGCGLVACKPWPLQFTPAFTRDRKALKGLKAPPVERDESVRKSRAHWSRLGFWPLGETGIHLLSMARRRSGAPPKKCKKPSLDVGWQSSLLERLPVTQEAAGSSPVAPATF
jgi:hypothetical protein